MEKLKRITVLTLAILMLLTSIPLEALAEELNKKENTGSLIEESQNLRESKTEITTETITGTEDKTQPSEEPKEATNKEATNKETPKTIEETPEEKIEEPSLTGTTKEDPTLTEAEKEKTEEQKEPEILPENNLIEKATITKLPSQNSGEEKYQIEDKELTLTIQPEITKEKDPENKDKEKTTINWTYKQDLTNGTIQNTKTNYTTIKNLGLAKPENQDKENLSNIIEHLFKKEEIENEKIQTIQIENKTPGNQENTVQTTIQTEEQTYAITITTTIQIENIKEPITLTNTYQITKENTKEEGPTTAQTIEEQTNGKYTRPNTEIHWTKITTNNTNQNQDKTIDLTPDKSQEATQNIQLTYYRLEQDGYKKYTPFSIWANKEENILENPVDQTDPRHYMRGFRAEEFIIKTALNQPVENTQPVETNGIPEIVQPETTEPIIKQEEPIKTTEEITNIEPGTIIIAEIKTKITDKEALHTIPGAELPKEEEIQNWEIKENPEKIEETIQNLIEENKEATEEDYLNLIQIKITYTDGSEKTLNYEEIKNDPSITIEKTDRENEWIIKKEGLTNLTFNPLEMMLKKAKNVDNLMKAEINIHKFWKSSADGEESLKGSVFELKGKPNRNGDPIVKEAISGQDGNLSFKDIAVPSYWLLTEKSAPIGYDTPNNQWIVHFISSTNEKGYEVLVYKAPLKPIVDTAVNPRNSKLDVQIWRPEEGREEIDVTLYELDGTSKKERRSIKSPYGVDTSGDGQNDAVSGATIRPQILDFWLEKDKQVSESQVNPFKIENKRRSLDKGELVVKKVDKSTLDNKGEPETLEDATFELRKGTPNGDGTYKKELVVNTIKTDSLGQATFKDLKEGVYFLREIRAPYGYQVDDTEWMIKVDNNGKTTAWITGEDAKKIPNGNSEQVFAQDKHYPNFVNMKSKIVDIDYEKGTFVQFVYLNSNGNYYKNDGYRYGYYSYQRPYSPQATISLPYGTSATAITKVTKKRVWVGDINTIIPDSKDFPNIYNYGSNAFVNKNYNDNSYSIDLKNDHDDYGYVTIVKVEGTFNKTSKLPLKTNVDFKASASVWNGYYVKLEYNSSIKHSVKAPEIQTETGDKKISNETNHPTIFKFSVDNKKSINARGKFFLDKTDGKEYLTGAEFILAREKDLDNPDKRRTISVDQEKSIEISNIPPGKYVLKETKSPIGYKLEEHLWDVNVDFFGNTTVTKRLKDGEKAEENTKFTGNVVNRQAEAADIPRMMRSFLSEMADDYESIPSNFLYEPTPYLANVGAVEIANNFTLNTKLVDSKENNKELTGIQLRLRRISPSYKQYDLKDKIANNNYGGLEDGAYILETYGSPYTGSTENNNRVDYRPMSISFEIKAGNLNITDSNVGNNWDMDNKTLTIKLEKLVSQDGYIHIINKPTTLEIKKVDSDKADKALPNASFELYEEATKETLVNPANPTESVNGIPLQPTEEQPLASGNSQTKEKKKISSATTNKDGILKFEKLEQGKTYYIKETVAPSGYELEKDKDGKEKFYGPYFVKEDGTISNGQTDNEEKLIDQPVIITNKKIERNGKVIVKKVDDNGNKLDGAEFDIYKSDDTWKLGDKIDFTNSDNKIKKEVKEGIHTFSNIPKGYYIIKESKAPTGYIISPKEISVEVKEDGQTLIKNKSEFKVNTINEKETSETARNTNENLVSMTASPVESSFESDVNTEVNSETQPNNFADVLRSAVPSALFANNVDEIGPLFANPTSDPMGLDQIYVNQDQPTDYKTDENGTYPSPTAQTEPTVRNSIIPETNLHWYEANYRQPDKFVEGGYRPSRLLPVAGVNKFAKETGTDGEYKIDLKVEGNLVNPDERVDIMIVYDNSNSMDEISPSGKRRFNVAKEATTEFINNVLSPENNPKGYIKMGLVTYGSHVFDGTFKKTNFDNYTGNERKLPDWTYADFTANPETIIDKLPDDVPTNKGYGGFGGTFTSGALDYAGKILSDETKSPKSHKKVIIHVTDGMPTKSLKVTKVVNERAIEFANGSNLSDGYSDVKGDGGNYWMADNGYYVSYTYKTNITFYNYYTGRYEYYYDTEYFYGTEEVVKNKKNTMENYMRYGYQLTHRFSNGQVYQSTISNVGKIGKLNNLDEKHRKYIVNGYEIKDHGFAAISLAKNLIENKGFEIYNLGIELGDPAKFNGGPEHPRTASKEEALKVMNGMSSDGGKDHYYDVSNVENLTNVFTDIFRKLPQRTVYKAQVMDPMGEMVDLKIDQSTLNSLEEYDVTENGKQVKYKNLYDGRGKNPAGFASGLEDFELTTSQSILKRDVLVLYNPVTRRLRIENFTLGENETLKLSYRVKLRTTDPNFIENHYYPTNGDTLLKPNPSYNAQWHFPRPSVKGPLKSIFVEKKWVDADGRPLKAENLPEVKVTLQQRVKNTEEWTNAKYANSQNDMIMTLNKTNNWKGKFINLIEYDNEGNQYEYRLLEESPTGYKSEITLKDKKGKIVGEIAGGQGTAEIVNRKLREIKVEKIWKTDDEASKKPVTVKLVAYKEDGVTKLTDEELKSLSLTEDKLKAELKVNEDNPSESWKHTFTGLPLETLDGKKIIYKVVEDKIGSTEVTKLDGFEVDYNYNSETGANEVINYKIPEVSFVNKKAVYPATGGIGTVIFTIAGMTLMGVAYYLIKKNEEE
ncbi:SpaA isopeptide-forming pilin-related protein [Peptoniphilus asaccharolyticus]